jgi:hypothetical protein
VSLRFARTALTEAVGPWTLWSAPPSAAGARADLATVSPPQILSYMSSTPHVTRWWVASHRGPVTRPIAPNASPRVAGGDRGEIGRVLVDEAGLFPVLIIQHGKAVDLGSADGGTSGGADRVGWAGRAVRPTRDAPSRTGWSCSAPTLYRMT